MPPKYNKKILATTLMLLKYMVKIIKKHPSPSQDNDMKRKTDLG